MPKKIPKNIENKIIVDLKNSGSTLNCSEIARKNQVSNKIIYRIKRQLGINTKINLSEYKEICLEWHPSKNGDIKPSDFSHGSRQRVWWQCKKNQLHEWRATPNSRTSVRDDRPSTGCPYCSGNLVNESNSLATLNPILASEWHPTKNKNLTPHDFTSSSGKKVWWLGICGHDWEATISSRKKGCGCPKCKQSKGEEKIISILDELKISYKREKSFTDCKHLLPLPFDFILNIDNKTLAIEYDGEYHFMEVFYNNSKTNLKLIQKRDKIKNKWCKSNNIPLLRIPYWKFDNIEELVVNFINYNGILLQPFTNAKKCKAHPAAVAD